MQIDDYPLLSLLSPVIVVALLFLPMTPSFSKEVSDPLQDFLSMPPHPIFGPKDVNSDVLRIEADINSDGKNEVFLSSVGLTNGSQGLMWLIYTPKGDHYACVGGSTFHPKAFFIWEMEGEGRCLVSYFHSSAASGSLIVTRLVGDHLEEKVVRMLYPGDNDKDRELYERLFDNQDTPKVEVIPLAKISRSTIENADKTRSQQVRTANPTDEKREPNLEAKAAQESAGGSSPGQNLQPTVALISMTPTRDLLCKNFDSVISAPPAVVGRYDDAMLIEEFTRRFYLDLWPADREYGDKQWRYALPSAQLQAVCWLAECNKRMCANDLELRARQRAKVLAFVRNGLSSASDPGQTIGLLDVAFRTVFYTGPVSPRDGADEVIDLFKQYVGNGSKEVHEFARERLRHMGSVWRSRYDEILKFLIERAPEIRVYLTAKPPRGMPVDILSGWDPRAGIVQEEEWLALPAMSPAALGAIVEKTMTSYRSQSVYAWDAINILRMKSECKEGNAAFATLLDLTEKGIDLRNTIGGFARYASRDLPEAESEIAQQRLEQLIRALPEAAKSKWEDTPWQPAEVVKNTLEAVQKVQKEKSESGTPANGANLRVQQLLSAALQNEAFAK